MQLIVEFQLYVGQLGFNHSGMSLIVNHKIAVRLTLSQTKSIPKRQLLQELLPILQTERKLQTLVTKYIESLNTIEEDETTNSF